MNVHKYLSFPDDVINRFAKIRAGKTIWTGTCWVGAQDLPEFTICIDGAFTEILREKWDFRYDERQVTLYWFSETNSGSAMSAPCPKLEDLPRVLTCLWLAAKDDDASAITVEVEKPEDPSLSKCVEDLIEADPTRILQEVFSVDPPVGAFTENQKYPPGFETWPEERKDKWFEDTARCIYIAQCHHFGKQVKVLEKYVNKAKRIAEVLKRKNEVTYEAVD